MVTALRARGRRTNNPLRKMKSIHSQLDLAGRLFHSVLAVARQLLHLFIIGLLVVFTSIAQAQVSLTLSSEKLASEFVTADALLKEPYVDVDEWRDVPLRHRYVHGGFKETETRFSFYFPPKDAYQGRFFQYITPFPDNENLSQGAKGEEDKIGFSISNGAYFIETNGGGRIDFSKPGASDRTIGAYRANAAAAQFSRVVAKALYGGTRPFGYAFGGSGGAYRTVGGIESTFQITGVQQGRNEAQRDQNKTQQTQTPRVEWRKRAHGLRFCKSRSTPSSFGISAASSWRFWIGA